MVMVWTHIQAVAMEIGIAASLLMLGWLVSHPQ
jgi:hypothetical protein